MNQEPQTRLINFGRPPKGERRVRFADTMGMELVSIFLFELINEYFHNQHNRTRRQIKAPPSSNLHSSGYHNNNTNNSNYNYTSTSKHFSYTSSNSHHHNNNNNNNNKFTAAPLTPSLLSSSSSSSLAPCSLGPPAAVPYSSSTPSFTCEFTQPISLLSFNERVKLNKVHLETCQIQSTAGHVSVSCTIRVLNISYDKSVIVRYTTDDWRTHADSLASYKPGNSDGWSDRFSSTFTVTDQVNKSFQPGQRIIFAIRCSFDGTSTTHWDNNGGLNYAIRTSMSSSGR